MARKEEKTLQEHDSINLKSHEFGEVENVRVVIRIRPINESEQSFGYREITSVDRVNNTVSVINPKSGSEELPKTFTFDSVFGTESTQLDVYNETARPIVEKVLAGYNGTIFAYGQTGTGKTYTMEGNNSKPELRGIIPNSFAHIFGFIAKADDNMKFLVRVSYLEIYNEEVRDLLIKDTHNCLEVKERPDIGVYVKDLSSYVVNNADDMESIMDLGRRNRVVGATAMNKESSRSHAIFTITIESSKDEGNGTTYLKMGKLHLVDLAGSERQNKTGSSGIRLKEATKINLSLSTLGNVISALVDGKSTHIPYRNSKLTRLLQDSLGGNSKTVMCANIGPADFNYDETISTLRYANRAKNIRNRARINEDPKDALLRQFQNEIEELKKKLDGCEDGVSSGSEDDGDGQIESEKAEEEDSEKQRKKALEDERKRVLAEKKNLEIQKAQQLKSNLKEKLESLEKKVLLGGENLLEKAEAQEKLLEKSAKELEQRRKEEAQLKQALEEKEAERIDIEERYSSLQEEAAGKTKKLKKISQMLMMAKAECNDLNQEHQREKEGLWDGVRALNREIQLHDLILNSYIPVEYQVMIERYVHWNEDIGEWQLKCVAYTGNNMKKQQALAASTHGQEVQQPDLSHVYLSYNSEHVMNSAKQIRRPKTCHTIARPYSAVPRPKSVRPVREVN
ncbi:UNVERIFIED_CONTAM: hypothetical protein PYX00_007412 [Menopon gallinae]|uniref:Kinesin-like protein n=1 Tax=Menopon gallinae TaxID=328185 RepID=A0AAW2HJ91_9NEOP